MNRRNTNKTHKGREGASRERNLHRERRGFTGEKLAHGLWGLHERETRTGSKEASHE